MGLFRLASLVPQYEHDIFKSIRHGPQLLFGGDVKMAYTFEVGSLTYTPEFVYEDLKSLDGCCYK